MQNHVTSFKEITIENDWWLFILRNHSQCTTNTSLMKNYSMVKKILKIQSEKGLLHFSFSQSWCKFKQKKNNFKARKPPQKYVKIHQIQNRLGCFPLSEHYHELAGGLVTLGRILSLVFNSNTSPIKIGNAYWKSFLRFYLIFGYQLFLLWPPEFWSW